MNPILLTGAISLGSKLVDAVLTPKQTPQTQGFEQLLKNQDPSKASSPLSIFLAQNHVFDFKDLANLKDKLHQDLSHSLGLKPGTFTINTSEQGIQITLNDGGTLNLTENSPYSKIAKKIDQIEAIQQMHQALPGASLKTLAAKVA